MLYILKYTTLTIIYFLGIGVVFLIVSQEFLFFLKKISTIGRQTESRSKYHQLTDVFPFKILVFGVASSRLVPCVYFSSSALVFFFFLMHLSVFGDLKKFARSIFFTQKQQRACPQPAPGFQRSVPVLALLGPHGGVSSPGSGVGRTLAVLESPNGTILVCWITVTIFF